jgi:hypothetical protein
MDAVFVPQTFDHARVIVGIVTGFSMARLLAGLARLIEPRARGAGAGVQLAWTAFFLLWVTHFWWFEFGPGPEGGWSFGLYLFAIAYAALFFFACAVLFPDAADRPHGFAAYFRSHRGWFYGLLAALFLADGAFAALKGPVHLAALGAPYLAKQGLFVAAALAAIPPRPARFDVALALAAGALQLWWIVRTFAPAL